MEHEEKVPQEPKAPTVWAGAGEPQPKEAGEPQPVADAPQPAGNASQSPVTSTPKPAGTGTVQPSAGDSLPIAGSPQPATASAPQSVGTGTPQPASASVPQSPITGAPQLVSAGAPGEMQKKKKPEADRLDGALSVLCLCAALFFTSFLLFGGFGISVPAFTLLVYAISFFYLKKSGKKPCRKAYWYFFLTIPSAAAFALFSSDILFLNFLFLFLVLFYQLAVLFGVTNGTFLEDVLRLPALLFERFGTAFLAAGNLFSGRKGKGKVLFILLTLLCVLPLTVVVFLLLMQADAAFEALFHLVFSKEFSFSVLMCKIILALPCWGVFFSIMFSLRHKKPEPYPVRKAPVVPFYIVLTGALPIIIMYLIFFLSQALYFQDVSSRLFPQGFTYAQYARRGFFELCALSAINLILIACINWLTHAKLGGRVLQVLLSAATFGFITLSICKMTLYIQTYDLTLKRVYTMWFMLFLGIVFLIALWKIVRPKKKIAGSIVLVASVMFLTLLCADADSLIARFNIERYEEGGTLDVSAMYSLSDSVVPQLMEIYLDPDTEEGMRDDVQAVLMNRCRRLQSREGWECFNLSSHLARQAMPEYSKWSQNEYYAEWYEEYESRRYERYLGEEEA